MRIELATVIRSSEVSRLIRHSFPFAMEQRRSSKLHFLFLRRVVERKTARFFSLFSAVVRLCNGRSNCNAELSSTRLCVAQIPRSARDDIIAVTRQRGSEGWAWIAGYDASITVYLYAVRRATRDLSTYGVGSQRETPCSFPRRCSRGNRYRFPSASGRDDIKRTYKTLILIEIIKYRACLAGRYGRRRRRRRSSSSLRYRFENSIVSSFPLEIANISRYLSHAVVPSQTGNKQDEVTLSGYRWWENFLFNLSSLLPGIKFMFRFLLPSSLFSSTVAYKRAFSLGCTYKQLSFDKFGIDISCNLAIPPPPPFQKKDSTSFLFFTTSRSPSRMTVSPIFFSEQICACYLFVQVFS